MSDRQLFLLSPYRPPTSYPVSLNAEEAAAWLNGYAALWHPLALRGALLPPLPASAYDHNDPAPGAIYALPGGPSLYLAEDWRARATAVGAATFDATVDRAATFAALLEALNIADQRIPPEIVRLFSGVGFGYLMLDTLFEAANHDRLLDLESFWKDVQAAADMACGDALEGVRPKLAEAAAKLQAAREGLNPGGVALLDLIVKSEDSLAEPWPCIFSQSRPVTLIATAETLTKMASAHHARLAELQAAVPAGVDLAVGVAAEREDTLLPIESQIWSFRKARGEVQNLFGVAPRLFGRTRSEYHPQLPSWLSAAGFHGMIALNLDGATLPSRYTSVIQWPGPDGKAINAFTRDPLPGHDPATFFNLAHHLHECTSRESSPTFALVHTTPAAAGYDDFLAISELANVFGTWHGLDPLLSDSHAAEYVSVPSADEFSIDTLDDRVTKRKLSDPVSGLAIHHRQRRRLDSAFTIAALHRSLTPPGEEEDALLKDLEEAEDFLENGGILHLNSEIELPLLGDGNYLRYLETKFATKLADRLLARSEPKQGWLVLNSSGSVRRVGLELEATSPIPVDGPVKASEHENGQAKVVVEVPGLGFAWIPRGVAGTVLPKPRIKTADGTTVRNEFLEAEIDPSSGGIRSIRDMKTGMTRFGQVLAWHAGSRMTARSVSVTHSGGVLGEVTSSGELRGDGDKLLAHFTQRIRAWMGRPALELRIELTPVIKPVGYAWQNFFGCRFAWRDDRATLFRGVNGMSSLTTSQRPQSPDYLEIRLGKERNFIFTGGLPFLQRQGSRMADVVLMPAGETATVFDLLIGFDRDFPMPTAQSWLTGPPMVAVEKGPPPIGTSGWLANFDLPSLLLTSLRPTSPGEGMNRAVLARFVETAGFAGATEMRFARDPSKAAMVDLNGAVVLPIALQGDAIPLDCSANELFTAKIEWA